MRLNTVRLQNFRQHVDTTIHFRSGLTGIIGPNGAGKSTILEAIAWCIYGAAAARGTNETIRFARASGGARVTVELSFELGGHEYRVARSLTTAQVFVDAGATPAATGVGSVTSYLESRLGMNRDEFFNTYFTGQKELQFLAQLGPRDRGRFLAQVLGYERLKRAQDLAKDRRKSLHYEILGIREVLPDEQIVRAERQAAEQRLAEAKAAAKQAQQRRAECEQQLAAVTPKWQDAQQKRERVREIGHEISAAERDGEAAGRELERAQAELTRIEQAERELAPLRQELLELDSLKQQCDQLAEQARRAERRTVLLDTQRDLKGDLDATRQRLKELESAPRLLQELTDEVAAGKTSLAELTQVASRLQNEWAAERQDVRTKLQHHLERHEELASQLDQLRNAGPDGTCPICTRPLGKEFDKVVGLLEEQFEDVKQNGKWLRKRETQLQKKPQELETAEQAVTALQKSVDALAQRLARCEQAAHEMWTLAQEQLKKEQRLMEITAELKKLPAGYDPALHERQEQRLNVLRQLAQQASRLEQIIEAKAARQREHSEASARARAALGVLEAGAARLEQLAFNPQAYDTLRQQHEQLLAGLHAADIGLTQARAQVDSARDRLAEARQVEKVAAQNRAKLRELEIDRKHQDELDRAFQQLRQELNARVRPELGELASIFLAEITDGRYTALEIDESYNILVLDEGEEKPVISGGEEDVANLVLRIAISQMIADRAGQQLSVLFLDEVFASLDEDRRENVIQLLHRLQPRFEQVVLITHVESIREGVDHVVRVSFDERTGASVVQEENVLEPLLV